MEHSIWTRLLNSVLIWLFEKLDALVERLFEILQNRPGVTVETDEDDAD